MTVRFGLLGPVQLVVDDRVVPFPAPRHRAVLAFLLLNARRPVPPERLIDAIWGESPPERARGQIQVAVSALRRTLRGAGAEHVLETTSAGYVLDVAPDAFDLDAFTALAGSDDAARLREALAVWRGPALADVAAPYVDAARARLADQRLTVVERLAELDLAAGRHAQLLDELTGWVAESPFRERLHRHLMLALYRLDRQPDALAVARDYRRLLADEHGLDPGQDFTDLERAILADDPALRPQPAETAQARSVPAQLPADVPDFVGRADELVRLDGLFEHAGAVVISTIEGVGGVGKTALAVRWGHRVRDLFPDGQLYVNLHGYSATDPVRPAEVLSGFLRALGVPAEEVPLDVETAAALYRSCLADRRILVVLDNAASPDQVRPLLPGAPHCRVVVTSRDRLAGLVARDGARLVELGMLPPAEAMDLLIRMLGRDRVGAEPAAAAELVRLCGGLPLAVRIAAAHLVSTPRLGLTEYVADVRRQPVAALEVPGDELSSIRAVFSLSYRRLPAGPARLFRMLGHAPGVRAGLDAAAALVDAPAAETGELLAALTRARLVDELEPGRYEQHDLLREYARELALAEDPQEDRDAALDRLTDWSLATADACARTLHPQSLRRHPPRQLDVLPTVEEARAWYDDELDGIVALARYRAKHGPYRDAWLLADATRGQLFALRRMPAWQAVTEAAREAGELAGDPAGSAVAELGFALIRMVGADGDGMARHNERLAALARAAGWPEAEGVAEGNMGIHHWMAGRLEEATGHLRRAVAIGERIGSRSLVATNVGNLANVSEAMGELAVAVELHRRALVIFEADGALGRQAHAHHNSGRLLARLGRFGEAEESMRSAVALFDRIGDGFVLDARSALADIEFLTGRLDDADRHSAAVLAGTAAGENPSARATALALRPLISLANGLTAEAVTGAEAALSYARETHQQDFALSAQAHLARAHLAGGDTDRALTVLEEALGTATEGVRVERIDLLALHAEALLLVGDRVGAADRLALAEAEVARTGYRLADEGIAAVRAGLSSGTR
ncbi:BTAD domain-containing putative transcriptional regulator [Longispora sp. K20-0274]|uniref:AfsR/SARP family transcriptional regulator n=1 Tax=Longispora sp. K20-0274 TaxID=3088255 RepID=UPI00399B7909